MPTVHRIVVTGGPCGGKTTVISSIKSTFQGDFIVMNVPEVATMTFNSGANIIPTNFSDETHKSITRLIC
jgi:hypothetical protein